MTPRMYAERAGNSSKKPFIALWRRRAWLIQVEPANGIDFNPG